MEFEWDEAKSRANRRKHGLDFHDAQKVFQGLALTQEDSRQDYGERPWITMGELEGVVVIIVHVQRAGRTRIISMRKANARERMVYEKGLF
jgi:uncharacterized DUF497 family protein